MSTKPIFSMQWLRTSPVAWWGLRLQRSGDIARDAGDWSKAAKYYSSFVQLNPHRSEIWLQLGHSEKQLGKMDSARRAYQQALVVAPDNFEAQIHLAYALHAVQDDTAAFTHLFAVGEHYRPALDAGGLLLVADIARNAQNWRVAADYYGYFLEKCPNEDSIWMQLGHAFKELKATDDAQFAYQQAVAINPGNFEVSVHLAYLHLKLQQKSQAYNCLQSILAPASPASDLLQPEVVVRVAELARDLGELDTAATYFEKYLHRRPSDLDAWRQLAYLEESRGNIDAARFAFAFAQLKAEASSRPGHAQPLALVDEDIRQALSPFFDAKFYMASNPDLDFSEYDPLAHYHLIGWREHRDPNPDFNTRYYLTLYTDVTNAGMDPLLHWVWAGRAEGRFPARPLDHERSQIEAARNPRVRSLDWQGAADNSKPVLIDALYDQLEIGKGLVVSVSHDDYTKNYGGVQNLIGDEQLGCASKGWDYLHLSPVMPSPCLADFDSPNSQKIKISYNARSVGVAMVADLIQVLKHAKKAGSDLHFVIHHLLGHAPERLLELIRECDAGHPTVWVHDFFILCPSYTLMRNDVTYCAAPELQSTACTICCYGTERKTHLWRIKNFFEATEPHVIAPAQGALDLWLASSHMKFTTARVQSLAQLELPGTRLPDQLKSQPLRIAHIGARVFHKGWFTFQSLAAAFHADPRYEFLQLGTASGGYLPSYIRQIPVNVTPDNRNAMIDAIAVNDISAVIGWSVWPETFCYTVHEALAAGAFVVCRRHAGNIWPAVLLNAPAQGHVLNDEQELHSLFIGDGLSDTLTKARRCGTLTVKTGSAEKLAFLVSDF